MQTGVRQTRRGQSIEQEGEAIQLNYFSFCSCFPPLLAWRAGAEQPIFQIYVKTFDLRHSSFCPLWHVEGKQREEKQKKHSNLSHQAQKAYFAVFDLLLSIGAYVQDIANIYQAREGKEKQRQGSKAKRKKEGD